MQTLLLRLLQIVKLGDHLEQEMSIMGWSELTEWGGWFGGMSPDVNYCRFKSMLSLITLLTKLGTGNTNGQAAALVTWSPCCSTGDRDL